MCVYAGCDVCLCIHNNMKVNVFDTCIFAAIYAGYML